MTAKQGEMQAYSQARMRPRQLDGFRRRGFVDNEAGAGQNALAMRLDHGRIDPGRAAEVVGINDQPAPAARLRALHSRESMLRKEFRTTSGQSEPASGLCLTGSGEVQRHRNGSSPACAAAASKPIPSARLQPWPGDLRPAESGVPFGNDTARVG